MATTGRFFPVQSIHLGQTGAFATYNESDVVIGPRGFSLPDGQLGMVVEDNGKVYRKVQHTLSDDAVATAAGGAAYWLTRGSFIVTADASDAEAPVNGLAGAYLGVVTKGNYCFIQIGGPQSVITDGADGGAAVGDMLVTTTTDLTFTHVDQGIAPVNVVFGVVYVAEAAAKTGIYWLLGNLL